MTATIDGQSSAKYHLLQALAPYQQRFHADLERFNHFFGEQGRLREATDYALKGEGKRVRPALVYMVADGLGHGLDVGAAATAIECAHCASMIADDLPMMDNDDLRRGRPTCHRAFDEATAVLSSYTLISCGFALLVANSQTMAQGPSPFSKRSGEACQAAVQCVAYQTGGWGLTIGQYKDLFELPHDLDSVLEIYQQKTSSLFQAAIALGWIFGGGDLSVLARVQNTGIQLGYLFQMANDCNDHHPQNHRSESFNGLAGLSKSQIVELTNTVALEARAALAALEIQSEPLNALVTGLHELIVET